MAIPPEPIEEIFPSVDAVVIAEVTKILYEGQQDFVPDMEEYEDDVVDIPRDLPEQGITLSIKKVLFGDLAKVGESLNVIKPAGDYVLRTDIQGPFLLGKGKAETVGVNPPVILGRYGLDSYPLSVIENAIKNFQK